MLSPRELYGLFTASLSRYYEQPIDEIVTNIKDDEGMEDRIQKYLQGLKK